MKYFLYTHKYKVNWFWGWGRDYGLLKYIMKYDASMAIRKKSSRIISGLHISMGYLILTLLVSVIVA